MVSPYTSPHLRHHEDARPTFASALSELRSVLAAAPDPARWGALVRCVEPWLGVPEREQVLITYAARQLERWPSVWRRAPQEWLRRASMGEAVEALALTRVWAPSLDARWYQRTPGRLRELLEHPALAGVERLDLSRLPLDARVVARVGVVASEALDVLAIEDLDAPNALLLPMFEWPARVRPTQLMARLNLLDDRFVHALLASAWWPHLRALDLSCNRLTPEGMRALRASGAHLDELELEGPCGRDPTQPRRGAP